MKLTNDIHVVGGGYYGFNISGKLDSHVYVINSGTELAIVDPGCGIGNDFKKILSNIRDDGLDPKKIRKIFVTHYHCDHIGAAAEARGCLDAEMYASKFVAPNIREGDEKAASLDVGKAAGFYPQDFDLKPCEVDVELSEGDLVKIGNMTMEIFETPGHCEGHLSFLLSGGERKYLFGGDMVFWGGRILLQNIHDCKINDYAESIFKIEKTDFDALLPGHLQISLSDGKSHVQKAGDAFRKLGVPQNLL
jgi:hydroxyacylglutathione hydrolase